MLDWVSGTGTKDACRNLKVLALAVAETSKYYFGKSGSKCQNAETF